MQLKRHIYIYINGSVYVACILSFYPCIILGSKAGALVILAGLKQKTQAGGAVL